MQYLRDNAGVLEASANGTDWEVVQVGAGGGTPDEIANPVILGTLQLRDNAGVFELSDDDGATWTPVGTGTGGGIPSELANPVTIGISQIRADEYGDLEFSADAGVTWFALLNSDHTNSDPLLHFPVWEEVIARPKWGNLILQTGRRYNIVVEVDQTFTLGQALRAGDALFLVSGGAMGAITINSIFGNVLLGSATGTTLSLAVSARGDFVHLVYMDGTDSTPTGWMVLDSRGAWAVA